MITTLRRRTHAFRDALAAADAAEVRCYSLRNHFIGETVDIGTDYLTEELERFHFAKLSRKADTVVLHVHSNLWYEWEVAA